MSLTIEQATNAVEDNLGNEGLADFIIEVDKTAPALGIIQASVYINGTDEEAGQIRIRVEVIES